VEKEAVVLFCEAMEVLGDRFAVAGFSGTGRLAVDYCEIKQWDEALDASVRNRIGALRPQRNTRMGAAVRHAAARFTACNARMRLLIMLSDGFPNDTGYKQRYAVEDTRAAILEARARGIHTHAITVQLRAASRLDAVYGPLHHTLIADARELPSRLLRLYGKLTR
jgi:nitric oxide reductase activation protein